jgi:hypothetical protein
MRIIGGIPEKDLIEFFLGDLTETMRYQETTAFSPSAERNINISTYSKYVNNILGVRVYYTHTAKSIRVSLKVPSEDPRHDHGPLTEWQTIKRIDVPVADPEGPEKVQKIINRYLDFSNRGTWVEMSEN